jgi:hypothetical protein
MANIGQGGFEKGDAINPLTRDWRVPPHHITRQYILPGHCKNTTAKRVVHWHGINILQIRHVSCYSKCVNQSQGRPVDHTGFPIVAFYAEVSYPGDTISRAHPQKAVPYSFSRVPHYPTSETFSRPCIRVTRGQCRTQAHDILSILTLMVLKSSQKI